MSILINGKMPVNVTFEAWFYPSGIVAFYDSNGNSLGASKWKELPPHAGIVDYDSLNLDSEWSDYEDGFTAYSMNAIRAACVPVEGE